MYVQKIPCILFIPLEKYMLMKVWNAVMEALSSIKSQEILSAIESAILRSTDSSNAAPDDKYIREILFLISNSPGSISFLSRKISTRLESSRNPLVTLKTLLLLHRLIRGGDRYFEKDLYNLWSSGDLKIHLRWIISSASNPLFYFILNYSKFLEERMEWLINQGGMLEPIRPLSVSIEEKEIEWILYRISKCQAFLDKIMDCLPAVNSRLVQLVMNVALRESFRVYESFNEDIEIVFSSFFHLKTDARLLSIDILRKACIQTCSLHEFYEKYKKFVVDRGLFYPSVRIIATDEISSLERFEQKETKCVDHSSIAKSKGEEEIEGQAHRCRSSVKPFSEGLEMKISMVWVEFNDEDDSGNFLASNR